MKIFADSCCDITLEDEKEFDVELIPLTLYIGDDTFIDDSNLDIEDFRKRMNEFKGRLTSSCPSPGSFYEAFKKADESFCITVSGNLSGTYNSAILGKDMAEEEGKKVEIIDSKSASAGEALIVYELLDFIKKGLSYEEIKLKMIDFVKNMKTYFVLENMDNLVKSGRLHKVAGKLISALQVRPIMGSDGDGNIKLYNYARSKKQIIEKMVNMVNESKKAGETFKLVIAHNNNVELANSLKDALVSVYDSIIIKIVPTRGLCSMYADNKGLIIAF